MKIANEHAVGSGKLVFSRGPEAEMGWRDLDVQVEGPVVADIARASTKIGKNSRATPSAHQSTRR